MGLSRTYLKSVLALVTRRQFWRRLVHKVYTVERISGLLNRAKELLATIGYRNIQFKHADGGMGWPERGPFDAIIVTASPGSYRKR